MSSTTQLVEHFFRHEYGRIIAVLTSRMGVANLQVVEDAVQTAMSRALSTWPRGGVPENPSAWLYRCAFNSALDTLRRQSMTARHLVEQAMTTEVITCANSSLVENEVGDETLRLLFLCCHPTIPAESRVALALKTIGGFSTQEIANGLLATTVNIEKRLTRAKETLREHSAELIELSSSAVVDRLESVRSTIYLIFNEGFAASNGDSPIRQDLCDEAIRLSRMLASHPACSQPATTALLSLLLLHSARLGERIDSTGSIILLADQDRAQWDWVRVREAMDFMQRSAQGDHLSRYHIEAAIAWEHSRAESFVRTDWQKIQRLYEMLLERYPSPAVRLNFAIAISYSKCPGSGLKELLDMSDAERRVLRPWWDCAVAQTLQRDQQIQAAQSHWRDALALATNAAQRALIERQLSQTMIGRLSDDCS